MAEEKAVATTTPPAEADTLAGEQTEEDFIKVKDEEDMPEASNDKKAGRCCLLHA